MLASRKPTCDITESKHITVGGIQAGQQKPATVASIACIATAPISTVHFRAAVRTLTKQN